MHPDEYKDNSYYNYNSHLNITIIKSTTVETVVDIVIWIQLEEILFKHKLFVKITSSISQ